MTGTINCPILIDPSSDFSLVVDSYQLWVYMQSSYFLICDFEGSGCLPQELQSFRKSELRKLAQTVRDTFGKHVDLYLFVAALAKISKVLLLLC